MKKMNTLIIFLIVNIGILLILSIVFGALFVRLKKSYMILVNNNRPEQILCFRQNKLVGQQPPIKPLKIQPSAAVIAAATPGGQPLVEPVGQTPGQNIQPSVAIKPTPGQKQSDTRGELYTKEEENTPIARALRRIRQQGE